MFFEQDAFCHLETSKRVPPNLLLPKTSRISIATVLEYPHSLITLLVVVGAKQVSEHQSTKVMTSSATNSTRGG